ncbi:MAG: response regulator [Parvibaculum sp.]|uniref:response regulator n=1 Tax=Parvibaculum sp. TaxID=2024848 RepID=UPI0025E5C450|nr:response regulator [Parvibaculum sp.]MCE9649456.1 response regulator [Parvibaculum sp.]
MNGAQDAAQASPAAPGEDAPHILVVDDDRRIRELIKRYLSEHGYRISTAENAAEARAKLSGLAFDLLVVDVMMPGESGLELTASLRRESAVPILMLTARTETEDRIAGLERGADDYLGKPFEPRELLLRIGTILRRAKAQGERAEDISLGECRFNVARGEMKRGDEVIRLTTREVQLMRIFATHPGQALSRLDLCDNEAAERSIDVQINRLRRKIEVDPRNPLYLQTVRGEGYVLIPD